MRIIDGHSVGGFNESITIIACDDPNNGGASHIYDIQSKDFTHPIKFQGGPVYLSGINGITHEALLAIIIDRMKGFQAGRYPCPENASALLHCEAALASLHARTRDRLAREVEGSYQG